MAYVSVSDLEHRRRSRLAAFFAECTTFAAIFGAAVRTSRAVENGEQPAARDLRILGVKTQLPLPGLR